MIGARPCGLRSLRGASTADALAGLERGSGTQFDPAVVDALPQVLAAPVAQPA
jgi:response regulator RpfG family c-di-GMP phosphodiesterase